MSIGAIFLMRLFTSTFSCICKTSKGIVLLPADGKLLLMFS
jgi:hypothetical protein